MANVGAIPALVGQGDAIYSDLLNHASLIDGCRLSRADLHVLPHADVAALEGALRQGEVTPPSVVIEGIYSMGGDLYPLDALVPLARRHDAWIYLDDAHGVGVLGPSGRGSAEHWGVASGIDITMGTLGKACGVAGAYVAGSRTLVDYLTNRARAFVYTTGSPPALAAAALTALDIVAREPERRAQLRANARRLRTGLAARGMTVPGPEDGHIVPVMIRASDVALRGRGARRGGICRRRDSPTDRPAGTARLRITVSAAHDALAIDACSMSLPPRAAAAMSISVSSSTDVTSGIPTRSTSALRTAADRAWRRRVSARRRWAAHFDDRSLVVGDAARPCAPRHRRRGRQTGCYAR
jgi:7-keto-8-aminopelargonate synthetase-like enzyme